MLLSLRIRSLTSLFKEFRGFKAVTTFPSVSDKKLQSLLGVSVTQTWASWPAQHATICPLA